MAKFRFSGTIKRVTVEYLECEDAIIDVTKKAVCHTLDLPNVVDGDPTHWVGEAEQAIEWGAPFKMIDTDGAEWKTESVTVTADDVNEVEYDV